MLDEYKISDKFWAEAINTACHAINRLYLHKILNKTAYKLLLGMEESSSQAIKKLAIGEIKPQEQVDNDNDDEMMFQGPSTSTSAAKPKNSGYEAGDSGHNDRSIRTPNRSIRFTQAETTTQQQDKSQDDREAEPIQHQSSIPHPRVHHIIQKDHPVDNILGSISKGVTT